MSAHTRGPWGLNKQGEVITANGQNLSIALVYPSSFLDRDEREANGRLLAAAPELLAACQIQADVDRLGELMGGTDIAGIAAIVDKYPGVVHQDMLEETAYNFLWRHAAERRAIAIAKATGTEEKAWLAQVDADPLYGQTEYKGANGLANEAERTMGRQEL